MVASDAFCVIEVSRERADSPPTFRMLFALPIARSNDLLGGEKLIALAPADVPFGDSYLIICREELALRKGWIKTKSGAVIEASGALK